MASSGTGYAVKYWTGARAAGTPERVVLRVRMRAAVYVRVSSPHQATGHSLDGQYREARAYCEAHKYRVVRSYRDVFRGGRLDRRAFMRMLDDAERGAFDVLVVWRRDRFGRTPEENGLIERHFRTLGIRLEAVMQGRQPDLPVTRLTNRVLDAISAFESETIGERATLGKREAARRGRWPQKPPYGFTRAPEGRRGLIPHPERSRRVLEAFRRAGDGHSTRRIADDLGVRHTTILSWLNNPAYLGHLRWQGIRVNRAWPPVVPGHVWGRAHAALAKTRAYYRRPIGRKYARRRQYPDDGKALSEPEPSRKR